MTKKFQVINNKYVVDKEATENDRFYVRNGKAIDELGAAHGMCDCKKLIAIIGKTNRIGNLPVIEFEDNANRIASMALYGAFPDATEEESKLYKEIYVNGYRVAKQSCWKDEDIIILLDSLRDSKTPFTDVLAMQTKYREDRISSENILAEFKEKYNAITRVELEVEEPNLENISNFSKDINDKIKEEYSRYSSGDETMESWFYANIKWITNLLSKLKITKTTDSGDIIIIPKP